MAMTMAGSPRGFFTQYRWAGSVDPNHPPYPEVESLFEACPWRDHLASMASHLPAFRTFGAEPGDPRWTGGRMFDPLDGAAAYAAVMRFKPRRVIEIGSGDSTFFLSRAARDAGAGTTITCIDPAPRREIAALPVRFEHRLLSIADSALCEELEENDILFIDSSHIMLPGMDVDIEFNRMFPRLKPGVVVHVHDIFLPDAYPRDWAQRNYSEQNALIGWLLSGYFETLYPGYHVCSRHGDAVAEAFGGDELFTSGSAGSIWLRRR
jgi:predicted O-methyltransferase YrrM